MIIPNVHIPGLHHHHHVLDKANSKYSSASYLLETQANQYDWVWGLMCCVMGSIFIALGLVLQKYSHHENISSGKGLAFYVQRIWVTGFLLYVVGQIGNLIAMAFAPQTMLSCLGTISLIFNTMFAWGILGEPIVAAEIVAMGGLAAGVVIVILIVPDNAQRQMQHTAAGMTGMLVQKEFLILAGSMVCFLLVVYIITRVSKIDRLKPIFYSLMTATLNGFNFTLWKCISMLVINLHHPFLHWQLFVVLGVVTPLVILQPITLNMALRSGEAMIVVPTNFAGGIIAQIFCGEVAFGELNFIDSTKEKCIFWLAVVLLCTSIAMMVRAQISSGKEGGEIANKDGVKAVRKPSATLEPGQVAKPAPQIVETPSGSTNGSHDGHEDLEDTAPEEAVPTPEVTQPVESSHPIEAGGKENADGSKINGIVLAGPIVTMTGPMVTITPGQQRQLESAKS